MGMRPGDMRPGACCFVHDKTYAGCAATKHFAASVMQCRTRSEIQWKQVQYDASMKAWLHGEGALRMQPQEGAGSGKPLQFQILFETTDLPPVQ